MVTRLAESGNDVCPPDIFTAFRDVAEYDATPPASEMGTIVPVGPDDRPAEPDWSEAFAALGDRDSGTMTLTAADHQPFASEDAMTDTNDSFDVNELAKRLGYEPDQQTIRFHREHGMPQPSENGRACTVLPITTAEGRTDLTNARLFKAMYGDRVRYCFPWNKWLVWNGTHWQIDNDGSIVRLGKAVADRIWDVANTIDDRDGRQFAAKTAAAKGVKDMLELARSEVPILPAELDQNAWLLNCPNGTVDLRSGELRQHKREDYITCCCPTEFHEDASSYQWDRFLEDVFGQTDMIEFVRRLFGYAATGDVSEQVLPIFWGVGANGKSTLLEAIQATVGTDYVIAAADSLLIKKKGESHPTELADLFGKRLVVATETEDNRALAESLVKKLTGGDTIAARCMREDFWRFLPTHKLILCTNHKPNVRGADHAIWRRLRLIPFRVRFEGERKDSSMPQKLRAEREGILAWIVRGCLDWQAEGLNEPNEVTIATSEYRSNEDVIGKFVEDKCLKSGEIKAGKFREALKAWCELEGCYPPEQKTISQWIEKNNYGKRVSNGTYYTGLSVTTQP